MMSAYIEKFTPACPPYAMHGSVMGPYYAGTTGPARGQSVFSEVDLSHRPGSLQEAICMYIDYLMAENELRTRISECAVASPAPPLDFHREEYYRDVMCQPVNFPTARFRDWLKRYNVDIEITDPDGQTVSQTTFAPVTPLAESSRAGESSPDGGVWAYDESAPNRRRQRPAPPLPCGGVICHAPRPIHVGPATMEHPLLHIPAESQGIPVEMLATSSTQPTRNVTPPLTGAGSLPSVYQAQFPLPSHQEPRIPQSGGYRSLPTEHEMKEEDEGLERHVMPVSGWPDMTLDHPESSRTGAPQDRSSYQGDVPNQPLDGSSADTYFQQEGTSKYDSRCCFTMDQAGGEDQHWGAGVIRSPVGNEPSIQTHLERSDPGDHYTESSSSEQGMDLHNSGTFPVVIEPTSPSGSCTSTGHGPAAVREFDKCFVSDGSAGYQLPYAAGSEPELYGTEGGNSQLTVPETGTTTPPSHSTDTAACLDLGSDFADLLGTQHSDEFDYHLNYANPITTSLPTAKEPNLPSTEELNQDVASRPRRVRRPPRSSPKSLAIPHHGGPARKVARKDLANH